MEDSGESKSDQDLEIEEELDDVLTLGKFQEELLKGTLVRKSNQPDLSTQKKGRLEERDGLNTRQSVSSLHDLILLLFSGSFSYLFWL